VAGLVAGVIVSGAITATALAGEFGGPRLYRD
jgi:hypothetical protein